MIADVAVSVVLELVAQATYLSPNGDRFVHVPAGPLRRAAIVKAQLVVGVPVCRTNPASEMKRDTRDPVRHLARRASYQRSDLARELLRHAFVSVERQDPVVPRNRR